MAGTDLELVWKTTRASIKRPVKVAIRGFRVWGLGFRVLGWGVGLKCRASRVQKRVIVSLLMRIGC